METVTTEKSIRDPINPYRSPGRQPYKLAQILQMHRRSHALMSIALTFAVHTTAVSALLWMEQEKEATRPPQAITVGLVAPPKPVQPAPPPPRPKKVVKQVVIPQEPTPVPEPVPQIEPSVMPQEVLPPLEPEPVEELPTTPPLYTADYLNNPIPPYPIQAKRAGIEGIVLVRVLVSPSGLPQKVEVCRTSGYTVLDEAALKAVKNWTFIPARQGKEPITSSAEVPIRFQLN
jgi:protein TonB